MVAKISDIKNYAVKIKQRFNAKEIILFGSYAYGKATKDSDIDLLVIMETKLRPIEQAVLIRKELPSVFPLDLVVRKPKDLRERVKQGDFFLQFVIKKGRKL
jgi:predicted nucleotidyltransferase